VPLAVTRDLLTKALFLYKIAFDKQARATGAAVNWIGQHSLLWGALGEHGFDEGWWLGLCAGLSIEWLKSRTAGGDLIQNLMDARNEAFTLKPANRPKIEQLATTVVASHREQNAVDEAVAGFLAACGSTSFAYPFDKMAGAFTKSRYYYISSGSHAMAACTDASGKVDFYDPNVGEVRGTSPRFFGPYLRDCIDASFMVTERPAAEKPQKMMRVQAYTKV
jgi:hypothetical protein